MRLTIELPDELAKEVLRAVRVTTLLKPVEVAPEKEERVKCEKAILRALKASPRMTRRDLSRKIQSCRYSPGIFEASLEALEAIGRIQRTPEAFGRIWIDLAPSDMETTAVTV
jgi:hypothetical protein